MAIATFVCSLNGTSRPTSTSSPTLVKPTAALSGRNARIAVSVRSGDAEISRSTPAVRPMSAITIGSER